MTSEPYFLGAIDAEVRMNEGSSLRVQVPTGYGDDIGLICREITDLVTLPEFRNQGFAEKLMQTVCDEADLAGFSLLLNAKPGDELTESERLQRFYAKFGFVVFQRKPCLMVRKHG